MKKLFLPLLFIIPVLLQGQGMWLPLLLEKQNEKDMKSKGMKISADDLYNLNKPSIKDAICMFGGGCTGELISGDGLLLTNHHCGFGSIQRLSSLEHNYVEDGYWAKSRDEEIPAPGLTATFVSRIEDVTALALQNVSETMAEADRQSQIDKNLDLLRRTTKREKWEDVMIRPFYDGNQYFLFVTKTYRDLRFVGAPPSSIGKFGADTDNWVWPRHTGDFSMFRVYADKDGHPADYATDNEPYHPAHFLPISLNGVETGDFTMVYGFPGRTNEYLTGAAVKQVSEVVDPARVEVRDKALKIMDGFMRKDPAIKIAYIAKFAGTANGWKKWIGEIQGLKTYKALEKKAEYEAEFSRRVNENADYKYRYGNLLPRLQELIQEIEPYIKGREYFYEACVRNNDLLSKAAELSKLIDIFESSGETMLVGKIEDASKRMDGFYKDYYPEVDKAVFAGIMEIFANNTKGDWGADYVKEQAGNRSGYEGLADYIFSRSVIPDKVKMQELFSKAPTEVVEKLRKDPAIVFWNTLYNAYTNQIQPKIQELQPQIDLLQRKYMAAQMVVFKEKKFFPDANSTLRLTYGKVNGYSPRDALQYEFQTDLDGVMEKYIPGDYEFDVPQKLIDLWKAKDYGQYATPDGRLPVGFIATNHTTGGNSGSPALDAKGNLIGLNFDRVWEGTMSDLNYDPAICRNIMVDVRYVLFIIDKFGGAGYLLDEMKLVKSKKKRRKR